MNVDVLYALAYLDNGSVVTAGDLETTVAWSTSKVPVAVAALRAVEDGTSLSDAATVQGNVTSAITASDNGAAQALWDSLGDPATAGAKVEDVLREGGDASTTVQTQVVRDGFTSFGQTLWSTVDQVRFAGGLSCLAGAQPVLTAMGQISVGQDYGLGRIPEARYKGGWGPDTSGSYQVRQFGLVPGADGTLVPVAVAVTSPDGSYESGSAALSEIVDQLSGTLSGVHGVKTTC
ncbi:putative secreted protein [Corynebacterium variabile DSM 44702]|uniref:Putative secreted protein n=1 Tax=Corynebacterium variabile (strain DSM 44702 / CIP 107183 / JCM 12073 / NCIMB 30131) TaxID=858619 RepID=G0HG24_CORVD|nr:putative secreted protein [Corynebacterium variabile DSM 44702]